MNLRHLIESNLRRYRSIRQFVAARRGSRSFSQEGEDILLARIFGGRTRGFYVDVGAHHPFRFSNTYRLYCRGWRGINVEPNPDVAWQFRLFRPNDIHVAVGVSETPSIRRCYTFNDPALNTLSAERAQRIADTSTYTLTGDFGLRTERLDRILEEHLPPQTEIDLLTIDVEGLDLEVLRSNDWRKYRPQVVMAEETGLTCETLTSSPVVQLMRSHGYIVFAKTFNTLVFRRDD